MHAAFPHDPCVTWALTRASVLDISSADGQ